MSEVEQLAQSAPVDNVEAAPVTETPAVEKITKEPAAKNFSDALERKIYDRDRYQEKKQEQAESKDVPSAESFEEKAAKEAARVERKTKGIPPSWSKNVADKWDSLPEDIRAEIAKREEEVTRGFTRDGEDKKLAREFKEVFNEYEKQGINFPRGYKDTVKELLNAAKVLNYGSPQEKLAYIDATARSVGLDLRSSLGVANNDSTVAQQNNLQNPEIHALHQKIAQLEGTLTKQMQLQDQMQTKEATEIIQKFASDPAHKYYHQVAPQMGQLIQNGFASSLEDAYEKAINLDPDLHSMRLEEARQEAIAKFREKLNSQTEAAKKAAVSITGEAPIGTPGARAASFEEDLARKLGVR